MKRLLWPFKVNAALTGFGVSPTLLDSDLRTDMQLFGREASLTPQETALVSLALAFGSRISLAGRSDSDEFDLILATLRRDRKIDFQKPEIVDALNYMGYATDDVPRWEHEAIEYHRGTLEGEPEHRYVRTPIAQLFAQKRWEAIKDAVEGKQ